MYKHSQIPVVSPKSINKKEIKEPCHWITKLGFVTAGQHLYSPKKTKQNLMSFCSPHSVNAAYWNIPPQGMQQSVITLVLRGRRHLGPQLSDLQLSQSGWLPTNYKHCQAFCITECFKQLQSFNLPCVSALKVSHRKGTLDHPDLINIGFPHLSVYHFSLITKIMYVNKIRISCSATLQAEKQFIN